MQKLRPDMNIGQNIKALRKKAGLTQEQATAQLQLQGCDLIRSTYSKMENNNSNIRISELAAMKKIFKAEWADFFVGLEIE